MHAPCPMLDVKFLLPQSLVSAPTFPLRSLSAAPTQSPPRRIKLHPLTNSIPMASLKPAVLQFKFDGFSSLPSEPDIKVPSNSGAITDVRGNAWMACINPGGGGYPRDDDVNDPNVRVSLSGRGWWYDFLVKRSEILNPENSILLDGTLIIDAIIQTKPTVHVSPNPFGANMLRLLDSNEDVDVSFEVDGELISAHKLVLKANSPTLFSFCEEYDSGSIPIPGMKPDHFRIILRYIYGADVADSVTSDERKELIIGADKLGVSGLKMALECALVQALVLRDDNVAEWLLFSDSMTCPLLKEHALAYFVARAADLVESKQTEKLSQSPGLMRELFEELAIRSVDGPRFQTMSVTGLRKALYEKGLDVDGSKEVLLSRLQESEEMESDDDSIFESSV